MPTSLRPPPAEVTALLADIRQGDRRAVDRLFASVYDELHRIAQRQLRHPAPQTLSATSLVHEAYLKLVDQTDAEWQDRAHFFAVSAKAMRHILLNYLRHKRAQKRGGDWQRVTLQATLAPLTPDARGAEEQATTLLALDDALTHLEKLDDRLARLVEYRFFAGLNETEIADLLGVSTRTVRRDWRKAKALLAQHMTPAAEGRAMRDEQRTP